MKRNPLHFTLGAALWLMLYTPLAHAIHYEEWSAAVFTWEELTDPLISGPEADADRDGRSNFVEFVLNSAPKAAGSGSDVAA